MAVDKKLATRIERATRGDAGQRLRAGDTVFAPRGLPHGFTGTGARTSRLLGLGTPSGHEDFFRDCAAAVADGTFSPETGAAICRKHGIELLGRPGS